MKQKTKGFTPHLLRGNTKKNNKNTKKGAGFSLMEVIIAIAVIIATLITLIALISSVVSGLKPAGFKLTAVSLAQEGLEIVRNIRDSNWLSYKRAPENWRDGLAAGDYRVQYNESALLFWADSFLKIDNNGFYQYDSGSNTPFKRKITIGHIGNNQIKAVSEITWQEKGKSYIITAESRLYNWLEVTEE